MDQSLDDKPDDSAHRPLMGRILVVDDEHVVRQFVQRILESDGHTVTTADSVFTGRAALQREIDVAVFDVELPDGQGFELVRALRASASTPTPIVMITGNPSQEALGKSASEGITEFLFKPFRGSELRAAVARALEAKLRWHKRVGALHSPGRRGLSDEPQAEAIPPSEVGRLLAQLTEEYGLTERERETLEHMLGGLQNSDIADALQISANTVKYHVRNLLTKLGMESRTELFRSLLNKGN